MLGRGRLALGLDTEPGFTNAGAQRALMDDVAASATSNDFDGLLQQPGQLTS